MILTPTKTEICIFLCENKQYYDERMLCVSAILPFEWNKRRLADRCFPSIQKMLVESPLDSHHSLLFFYLLSDDPYCRKRMVELGLLQIFVKNSEEGSQNVLRASSLIANLARDGNYEEMFVSGRLLKPIQSLSDSFDYFHQLEALKTLKHFIHKKNGNLIKTIFSTGNAPTIFNSLSALIHSDYENIKREALLATYYLSKEGNNLFQIRLYSDLSNQKKKRKT